MSTTSHKFFKFFGDNLKLLWIFWKKNEENSYQIKKYSKNLKFSLEMYIIVAEHHGINQYYCVNLKL